MLEPITSTREYKAAMQRLEVVFDATPGTAEGAELEALGLLIEKYEDEHYPVIL